MLTQDERPATKDWADSYLYAFAESADLHLVTFDQALRQKSTNVLLPQLAADLSQSLRDRFGPVLWRGKGFATRCRDSR